MKKCVMIAFMLVTGGAFGMKKQVAIVPGKMSTLADRQKQNERMAGKLKLVLTAGKCVYDEHQVIHWDVLSRAKQMCLLLRAKSYQRLATNMDQYAQMLNTVIKTYSLLLDTQDSKLAPILESSHRSCLAWALALPKASKYKLSQDSLRGFITTFSAKKDKAEGLYKQAQSAQKNFVRGIELSVLLPIDAAVTAWCVELPSPIFEAEPSCETASELIKISLSKEKHAGLFESFGGSEA